MNTNERLITVDGVADAVKAYFNHDDEQRSRIQERYAPIIAWVGGCVSRVVGAMAVADVPPEIIAFVTREFDLAVGPTLITVDKAVFQSFEE